MKLWKSKFYCVEDFAMVINVEILTQELSQQGRTFKWPRPSCCPKCRGKLWGHGHVFSNNFFLKRYRCYTCKSVITLKPFGFWPKYRTSVNVIYTSLRHRLMSYSWQDPSMRHRALHWIRKFTTFVIMLYGMSDAEKEMHLVDRLDSFYQKGIHFLS